MMDEAEMGVLGCILTDSSCIYAIYDSLKPEMFKSEFAKNCYMEMLAIYDKGEKVTNVELVQKLESNSVKREDIIQWLCQCVVSSPSSACISNYAKTIITDYKSRYTQALVNKISYAAKDINNTIPELILRLEELEKNESVKSKTLSKIVDEQENLYFTNTQRKIVKTGFYKLDDCIGGCEGGDVIVIGARPGVGKSAISLQMIEHICSHGKKVGYFNLEMTEGQVFQRLNSRLSKISITRIKRANAFLGDEEEKYKQANEQMKKMNLVISTGTKTVSEIRNESRHQQFDVIVIDYLQLIKADRTNSNRASEVGYISKSIKELAMELKVPILLLSQLNRVSEARETKEPNMSDLRESGDIEQDASIIILLWKLKEDGKYVGLKVDKNRQGGLLKEGLSFDGETVTFMERMEEFYQTEKLAKASSDLPNEEETPFG